MLKIIDDRGTGKTSRLMLLAKENENGTIICRRPTDMREKAYAYGITGLNFISYSDYFDSFLDGKDICYDTNSIYIDNLSDFLFYWDSRIKGYCDDKESK